MFSIAILIGIYSYLIFIVGILGFLNKSTILTASLIFILSAYFYFRKKSKEFPTFSFSKFKPKLLLYIFLFMALINLIGALGPEFSFDALWYHLTIPKIFINEHKIFFIPGGLFYYSIMPKLGEMLFIPALMFGNEIISKLIQWTFGMLSAFVVYKISRNFFDQKLSIIASLIFYSSLVVAWQSTIAYIDLIRTFFEIMALWGFLEFYKSKNKKWLVESAVMVGLAISTKLIALGTILIFVSLLLIFEKNRKKATENALIFFVLSLLVPIPWFFFSFLNTGNPLYPIFSGYPIDSYAFFNFQNLIEDLFQLFFKADDPISPVYIMFLPLIFILFKNFDKRLKIIALYSLISLMVWYLTPRTGGGRFILPYLPVFSILASSVIANIKIVWLKKYLTALVIAVCLITITYRGIANSKFIPVILGQQTKDEFLTINLNFSFGDFYDTDGWFAKNISGKDKVLLFGFHNLYYANFPFIHESYVKKRDKFNYIATQNSVLPQRFSYWNLIYYNKATGVGVYSLKGEMWHY